MSSEEVILRKEGRVVYLFINREKALNALNLKVMTRLDQIFSELESDEQTLVIIITGVGLKAFVAGADIHEVKEAGRPRGGHAPAGSAAGHLGAPDGAERGR